jgi:hypothetical protein
VVQRSPEFETQDRGQSFGQSFISAQLTFMTRR